MMIRNPFLRLCKIIVLFAFPALLIFGCTPTTQFILMPDSDGKVGVMEISTAKGTQTLNQEWQATKSTGMDKMPSEPKILEKEDVRQAFREALAAEPIPPVSFIMYFKTDSSVLSMESLALLTKVLDAIHIRKSTDIIVSGHTDATGSLDYNRSLSLQRANAVAGSLVSRGIDRQIIQVTYHGKGNPLVPTPEGIQEPRNRRVEITVR